MKFRVILSFHLLCLLAAAQTNVTLLGHTYPLRPHPRVWLDGPQGALTTAMSARGHGGRANSKNPMYRTLVSQVDAAKSDYRNKWYGDWVFASAALRWLADGDSASLKMALWGINNYEKVAFSSGLQFYCNESSDYCSGRGGDLDHMSLGMVGSWYSIVRGQLTPAERTLFAQKILNDNSDGARYPSTRGNGIGGAANNPAVDCVPQRSGVPWASGNCGIIWLIKHHHTAPRLIPSQSSHYPSDYPRNGGQDTYGLPATQVACNLRTQLGGCAHNLLFTKLMEDIQIGLALADDDPRAVTLLQQSFDYYIHVAHPYAKSAWTGFDQADAGYTPGRYQWMAPDIARAIKNSVINGPDLTKGVWLDRFVPYTIYDMLPMAPGNHEQMSDRWGDIYDSVPGGYQTRGLATLLAMYPNDNIAPFGRDWLANWVVFAQPNSQKWYTPWLYVGYDPGAPKVSVSSLPTQYLFRASDYAECVASFGTQGCYPNERYDHAISKTDWTPTATQIMVESSVNRTIDHNGSDGWGVYHIYRNGYLLAGNRPNGNATLNSLGNQDNGIGLGGGFPNWQTGLAPILRWGGPDPGGDPQSRYFYLMDDLTPSYIGAMHASRVHRHILHLKKPGTQDYILNYDDVATSSGTLMQAYYHLRRGGTISTDNANRTVTNVMSKARLNGAFLPVGGPRSIALVASAPGEYTQRHDICASTDGITCSSFSTSGEWIAVWMPTLRATAAMPPITQPGCGANCTAVQIADPASPKVAVFARQGNLLNRVSLTTTFAGTAQHLIVGLGPGQYTINAPSASPSHCTVVSGDNTCHFEARAGAVAVERIP